jgi:hypothetical protein
MLTDGVCESWPVPTPASGRLPDFVVIGAMKAGTTSLASWLRAHPGVYMPPRELHFFTENWKRGTDWYAEQFAEAAADQIVGEKTPTYILSDQALQRIRDLAPDVKLIVCVREPVERAWSHYRHWRRKGEPRPFAQACAEELARGRATAALDGRAADYLAPGRYAQQLEHLTTLFDRDRVLVVFLEELEDDPEAAFARVGEFLGLAAGVTPKTLGSKENFAVTFRPLWLYGILLRIHFGKWAPKWLGRWVFLRMTRPDTDTEPMQDALRAALRTHFAADNAALAAWLGRPLPGNWSLPEPTDRDPRSAASSASGAC